MAAPFNHLTKKGQPNKANFDESYREAIARLKEALTHLVLKVADLEQPFILQTDASDVHLGAVLSQEDKNDEEHPVA